MPRISVVMPVWNVEPYLRECMDSILNQTMRDFEFICIDDASDDGSPTILREYAARDGRVKVLQTEHVGAYLARRAGVDVACGEFVYFMDSDDILDVNAFAELLEVIDRERLDQVIFSAEVFSDDGDDETFKERRARFEKYYDIPVQICNKPMPGPDLMFSLERAGHFFVSPPFRLTRLAPFKDREYPFPYGAPFHADEFFTPASLYFSDRAMIVNKRYYKRRVRPGSISTVTDKDTIHFTSLLNVLFALCCFKPFQDDLLTRRAALSSHMLKLLRAIVRRGERLDIETQTQLLDGITFDLPPEARFFLATCFIPLLWELRKSEECYAKRVAKLENEKSSLARTIANINQKSMWFEKEVERGVDRGIAGLERNLANLEREIKGIRSSASYRVGMAFTWPLRMLFRLVTKHKGGR